MTLFRNKYRIETTRLPGWDYTGHGWYFVTICTRKRDYVFGQVTESDVQLNAIGDIAAQFWQDIPSHFPQVRLDEFVVMPNHMHGIIALESESLELTEKGNVETRHVASPVPTNKFGPLQAGSLSKIIQAYKAAVTRWCRANQYLSFEWQSRFYDHIIRNERSLMAIREYIVNNPAKWELDREKPQGLWM